ncbi:hypothetical protein JDV02_008008 [Purpureocillium takamizusanense]|uniref:Monopolin complex subunit Csm1/Pcs1 C-terminal domain-containing protein n=1 Tax=Purpureocillium takamizusanense TaxID=2060973 RepID=A0A9Q8VEA4_9HYPO|nr:uncharacterized protein JDV02_008008 [Purpureocillium takamizusanense]UNI22086.1 hypothetical protein JDV02_008008 [Purpureocillium takamizusanense]
MAPRARVAGSLAGMVASDSEPDFDDVHAIAAVAKTAATTKRPRGRPPGTASKVTKPGTEAATRRVGGKGGASASRPSRQALADKSNTVSMRTASKGVKKASQTTTTAGLELDGQGLEPVVAKATRGRPKGVGKRQSVGNERAAEQPGQAHGEETEDKQPLELMQVDAEERQLLVATPDPGADVDESNSIADDGVEDVSLRRRLGDLTRKYENLEMRYRDLKDVGVRAAERNFEHLKRQADENIAGSNELIAQLQQDLASQIALAQEGERVRQELRESENSVDALQVTVDELTASLTAARTEIKTLSTKLAASRSAEMHIKAPGSALKGGAAAGRNAQSEALHALQAAQAKEDLYGDLTGLIVRGLRQGDVEDMFDCIQTGRNGTLHFKLALERAEGGDSYEDVQFTYKPQLDTDRDGELMEMLPDYLREEITFPRAHASKFYSRVTKSLTERVD